MSMKAIKKIVATVGERSDGKKVYSRVGTMFKRDDGTFTLKIDSIPISTSWDGWVNLYDMDPPKEGAPPAPAPQASPDLDDEIPF